MARYCAHCALVPFCSKIDRRIDKTLLVSLMSLLILCEEEEENDQQALDSANAQIDTGQIAYNRSNTVSSPGGRRSHKKGSVSWASDVQNRPSEPSCTCTADTPPGQSARTHLLIKQLQTRRRRADDAAVTPCGNDCGTATDVWTRWSCQALSVRMCNRCEHGQQE